MINEELHPKVTILQIPPEILSRIFMIGKDRHAPGDIAHDTCTAISQSFRQVALGTPLLWRTVQIDERSNPAKVAAYCVRSLPALLDVRIMLQGDWHSDPARMHSVYKSLDVIARSSSRWQKFTLRLDSEPADQPSIADMLCQCAAPLLEYLSLWVDCINSPNRIEIDTAPSTLTSGTNLRFLRLRGLSIHFFRPRIAQLTILHLDQTRTTPMRYSAFKQLLTASPSLQHLSLYGITAVLSPDWSAALTGTDTIQLDHLESLRISSKEGGVFAGILFHIQAPRLASLVLRDMQDNDLRFEEDGVHAGASFPQVKDLTFCGFELSHAGYCSMFELFPSVESFHCLSTSIGVSNCFEELGRAWDGVIRWPKLRALEFGYNPFDDPDQMGDLLSTRKEMGLGNISFRFATDVGEEEEVYLWLEQAVGDPIEATVVSEEETWPAGFNDDHDDTLFQW